MTVILAPRERVVLVDALGHAGDGLVHVEGAPVHVARALPGERVRIAEEGKGWRLVEVIEPAPERVSPVCGHFGTCGGCALQHLAGDAALAWKRERVVDALVQRGLVADVEPARAVPPASRRRIVVALQRRDGRVVVGFRARRSHDVVPVIACPVARPALVAALPAVARLGQHLSFGAKGATVTLLETRAGLDVAIADATLGDAERRRLVTLAAEAGFARLSLDGEVLTLLREPVLDVGGVAVVPPPGGFVQAVAEAERLLADAVLAASEGAGRVADLFAGCGTFALRLARRAKIHAVEADGPALAALERAARGATGLGAITTERRDLARHPLGSRELERFDAVVFDPPRDGSAPQAKAIAQSRVPVVVAVSCNPATLARDLRYLVDGGYRIERVLPVDQFPFTPHVEAVAVLRRERSR